MKPSDLNDLFIYDLANNHQGDIKHAKAIIQEVGRVNAEAGVRGALKFQFRQLDTFIHPDYQDRTDIKFIKRFRRYIFDNVLLPIMKWTSVILSARINAYESDTAEVPASKWKEKVIEDFQVWLKEMPEEMPGVCIEIGSGTIPICGLCVETGLAKSNSEAKRLLSQGAIQIDGERVNTDTVCIKDGSVIKVGKRRFVRIVDADKRS